MVNGTYEPLKRMKVSAKIYSLDAKEKGSREATMDLGRTAARKRSISRIRMD